jgi:hypothetical protein
MYEFSFIILLSGYIIIYSMHYIKIEIHMLEQHTFFSINNKFFVSFMIILKS